MSTPVVHPTHLGKYQVRSVLGEGAMGVVYKGFDPGIQRVVALKTVRRQLLEDDEQGSTMAARFRNEAQAAGRLSHPGIVAVYDYGEEATAAGGVAYIAMEYVEGNTLQRYIANQVRFTERDIASVVVQLLDALDHAHEQGVWHRDVKPGNVLMTREGKLKVADFGIARIENAGLTRVSTLIGTPSYMAPEQFQGLDIDRRVDIYATGALFYQLLVGQPPFTGSAESLSYRVVHEAPVLPSAVPGCTRGAAYDGVLAVALAKNRAHRYPSAEAFKQALMAVLDQPPAATVSDETIIAVPPRAAQAVNPGAGTDRLSLPVGPHASANRSANASANGVAGTAFEPGVLAKVEASLARHVGPLAAVLVRRSARDCSDLHTLVQRLAEQVPQPAARTEFLTQAARHTAGAQPTSGASLGSRSMHPSGSAGGAAPSAPGLHTAEPALNDEFVAQSIKLLATHVGPIASVLAKRAAARAPGRHAFVNALLEAVTDAGAREKLRADLERLA